MSTVTTHYEDKVLEGLLDHRYGPSSAELTPDQVVRVVQLRAGARLFARQIAHSCPPSWERDQALNAVDEACSYAARSISRNE